MQYTIQEANNKQCSKQYSKQYNNQYNSQYNAAKSHSYSLPLCYHNDEDNNVSQKTQWNRTQKDKRDFEMRTDHTFPKRRPDTSCQQEKGNNSINVAELEDRNTAKKERGCWSRATEGECRRGTETVKLAQVALYLDWIKQWGASYLNWSKH